MSHCHAVKECKEIAIGDCVECGKPVCAAHALKKSSHLFCSEDCLLDREADFEEVQEERAKMREALEAALYGMDELIRSYTITHVVRGQCKGQPRITVDEMSAASEAEDQYHQARHKVEAALKTEVAK